MNETQRPITPDWALSPLEEFGNQSERLAKVVRLSVRGMQMTQSLPKMMEVLRKADGRDLDAEMHRNAVTDAEFIEQERSSGFPVVHGQAILSLWSLLELTVKDLIAVWIKNKPDLLLAPPISNYKIKIGDYLAIDEDERCLFFVDVIERDLGAGVKNGINRFESLLEAVGLTGVTPDKMNQVFFEFGQVRNALAHRGGFVDKKLIDNCPWLDLKIGEAINPNLEMFQRYFCISASYTNLLICRTAMSFGRDMQSDIDQIINEYS